MWHKQVTWDGEADVVVLGFGGAGAVAAMTAHDAGASVLVLECQQADRRHPATYLSGGSFLSPSDADAAFEHVRALYRLPDGSGETPDDVLRAWATRSSENLAWVESHGGSATIFARAGEHHEVPGHESIQAYRFDQGTFPTAPAEAGHGYGLYRWLHGLVDQRDIHVEHGVRARWLVTDAAGDVLGVEAERDGRTVRYRAARAVVLTTGGFEFDETLKRTYLSTAPTHFYSNPDNRGDGLVMAQEVGAALWHMSACSAKAVAKFPDFPIAFPTNFWGYGEGFSRSDSISDVDAAGRRLQPGAAGCGVMQVDRFGRRFTSELWKSHTHYYELMGFDSQRELFPRIPTFWIFDEARMGRGQLALRENGPAGPLQLYPWSDDNQAELDRGWITVGRTVEELAARIGVDVANLRTTLRDYNRACENGVDPLGPPPVGRPAHTLVPLEPPFYAVPLWPGGPNTQGGPRRGARAEVIRVTGAPVPGLFAAGELGSIYGTLYPGGGGNLAECIAFGRIAGESAAQAPRR